MKIACISQRDTFKLSKYRLTLSFDYRVVWTKPRENVFFSEFSSFELLYYIFKFSEIQMFNRSNLFIFLNIQILKYSDMQIFVQ